MNKLFRISTFAVAGAAAYGLVLASPAMAKSPLTIVSWGGAYTKSQVQAYYKPFTKKTGVKIHSVDYNGGLAQVKAQVESGNVTWSLVDVELSDAIRGCDEGLLEPIDPASLPAAPDGTPAIKDFIKGTLVDCGVGEIVWSNVVAYNSKKFKGNPPKSIKDFFNIKKFPGKRGLKKAAKVNLEWALIADGVPLKDVYKVLATKKGVDRAFRKLDTIKKDIVWWEAGAQPPELLADGEVAMTSAYNGRLFNAIVNEKQPFVIIWKDQIWDIDLWSIPKGAKNLKEILKFVKFSTDTQRLADQTKYISYGPVRKSSMALVSKKMQPQMPTYPANFKHALQSNFEFWADNQDQLTERFMNWLAK